MIDRLLGYRDFCIHSLWMACVGVPVPHGEVAAGEMYADAIAFQEDVAGGEQINGVFVDLSRHQQTRWLPDGLTKPGADESFGEVVCRPIRIDVDQAGDKVRIPRGGGGVKLNHDGASHLTVLGHRVASENQNVLPVFVRPLVNRARTDDAGDGRGGMVSPQCRNGCLGIAKVDGRRLVPGGLRGQSAVFASVRVEIVPGKFGPRQGPLMFVSSLIDTHHENPYLGLVLDAVVLTLQEAVQPANG